MLQSLFGAKYYETFAVFMGMGLAWMLELVSCKWEVNFNNQSTKSLVVRTLTNRNPEEEGEEAGSID